MTTSRVAYVTLLRKVNQTVNRFACRGAAIEALRNLAVVAVINTRHCRDGSVSGLVSVVFIYKYSLRMAAPLLNVIEYIEK